MGWDDMVWDKWDGINGMGSKEISPNDMEYVEGSRMKRVDGMGRDGTG